MENGRYGRQKKRLRTFGILLLSVLVLFGGRKTWKTVLENQVRTVAEEGRERAPLLFGWIFRHYYPAGAAAEEMVQGKKGEEWWLEWLWDSLPLYRYGTVSGEIIPTAGREDPSYQTYVDNRRFATEYEALLGWGGEDTQAGGNHESGHTKTGGNGEEPPVQLAENTAEAGAEALSAKGLVYPREQLADYDFMMSHFFSVHSSTTAGRDIMSAAAFLDRDLSLTKTEDQPQILIYHTHSQETFADYGPENTEAGVVGLGSYLAELLKAKGYNVIHDTSVYDLKDGKLDRSRAYTYALEGISGILQDNPSIEVVLDIHRDGVKEGYHMVSEVNGKQTAPIMFFDGMSRTPTGPIEYLPNPNLESNLAFSFQMQLKAAEYFPGLTRKIYLKGLRYNLHVRPRSALIEVGAQTNTYEEARNAMEPLAEVLDMVLQGK